LVTPLKRISWLGLLITLLAAVAGASSKQDAPSGLLQLSKQNRVDIERAFTSDLVYTRTAFPMGKAGLSIDNGQLTPFGPALQQAIDTFGLAAQRGDLVQITGITLKDDHIRFEINGGPEKVSKWYQKITVYGPGGTPVPVKPGKPGADAAPARHGSFVDLHFETSVRELTVDCLKELLHPVFDFAAKSSLEAYLDTVPPMVQQAIRDHRVLVGMNREMLIFAKGLPTQKTRENNSGTEYEDWIYGAPPQDVEFVRMINNEVVRVETMKINGQRVIREEREIQAQMDPDATSNKQGDDSASRSSAGEPGGLPCSRGSLTSPTSAVPVPSLDRGPTETVNPSSRCACR